MGMVGGAVAGSGLGSRQALVPRVWRGVMWAGLKRGGARV